MINQLLIDRIPFHDWPLAARKAALAAIIPLPLPTGEGGWTLADRMSLDLLRYGLPEARSFGRIPEPVMTYRRKLVEEGVKRDTEVLSRLHAAMEQVQLRKGFLEGIELELE